TKNLTGSASETPAVTEASPPVVDSSRKLVSKPSVPSVSMASPTVVRCDGFWLGTAGVDGSYLYLSDYTKLTPVNAADKATLAQWERGQRLERCGRRITNKDKGQYITVSE
ncbi:hypothetical protein, partial [Cupriavidus sp. WS]|uniref:hypothetical protein n=1 Tax=Cupriavidus sp. WS TaxID=1312922 RepID=UPI0018CA540A